jgi:hypothetical protein
MLNSRRHRCLLNHTHWPGALEACSRSLWYMIYSYFWGFRGSKRECTIVVTSDYRCHCGCLGRWSDGGLGESISDSRSEGLTLEVGLLAGIILGSLLGALVKVSEGRRLGSTEGWLERLMEAWSEGMELRELNGSSEGKLLEALEGSSEGNLDGRLEGLPLGSLEGWSEGKELGAIEGWSVRFSEEESEGSLVGLKVGKEMT